MIVGSHAQRGLKRRTLTQSVTITGIGIHTGEPSTVHLRPAAAHTGILFRVGGARIPARQEFVVDTSRCTVLGGGGERVSTVEHLLSACAGCGVSDLIIEVDGPELPIGDGSAFFWTEALLGASGEALPASELALRRITEPVIVMGKKGAFVALYPADELRLTVSVAFEHPLVETLVARFEPSCDDYSLSVAPARTFGFIEEVEALLAAGLAKGGSFDNAVVIYPDHYSAPLRFDNELARHKLLDLMGDLLLATGDSLPVADIIAVKPSHRLNTEAAKALAAQFAVR